MVTALRAIKYYQIFGLPLIVYIGVLALVFLLGTAIIAMINRRKGSRSLLKWHHRLAGLCIIFALFHGLLGISGDTGVIPGSEGEGGSKGLSGVRTGADIFDAWCSGCHPDGKNIIYPDFPIKGSGKLADFPGFLNFIRNPLLPGGAKGPMPSFPEKRISDEQAGDLYHYLISEKGLNAKETDHVH